MSISEHRPRNVQVDPDRYYATSDLCDIFGVTRQTVHKWRNAGYLRGAKQYRARGPWYYPGETVAEFQSKARTI